MQVAAHDAERLRRAIGGSAGVAVAAYAGLELLVESPGPGGRSTAAAVALAGVALALLALPVAGLGLRPGRRLVPRPGVVRLAGRAIATVAAAVGVAPGVTAPATALATLLTCAAVALLDVRLPATRSPLAVPLVAAATLIVGVAALPGVAGALPGTMSAAVGTAVLALAGGTFLASGAMSGALSDPVPVDPAPVDPAPVDPAPVDPAPVDPAPVEGPALDRAGLAEALLESMNEAVMVLDANYRVLDVNRRWTELTGQRPEDVIGREHPDACGPGGGGEGLLHRVDGTDVPVRATLATVPDSDGRPGAYVATFVDVAEVHAEEELVERASELEHSNARLRESNTRLESALAFKNDVMAMLGHDMSQPVTSIFSMSDLLVSDWPVLEEQDRLDLATRIGQNTHRLIRMMEDLNLLFRLDTGSITVRRSPIPVREVVENVAGALNVADVGIAVDDGLSALVDREHLRHVVKNLLTNAVAYGGPPIEIMARREEDRVVLIVQDHGPGIPEDLVPKLFDRFMRGAGLGLFIVRHLVQANGGSVRYEHAEPRGARLVVELEADTPHR